MKFINTLPIGGKKENLASYFCSSLFDPKKFLRKSYKDNINVSIMFLEILELYKSPIDDNSPADKNKVKAIFEHLLKNNYLILYNDHKTNVDSFIHNLYFYITQHKVDPKRIYLIVFLPSEVPIIRQKLDELGLSKIHITYKMNWLLWTKRHYKPKPETIPIYKFSVFTRRFCDWRLQFYCKLIKHNLLSNTVYTFSNSHPDFENSIVKKETMLEHIQGQFSSEVMSKINVWMDSLPVTLKDDTIDPVSDIIFTKLLESHIHIVCETHVHHSRHGVGLTEKIFKPIVAGKPFVVVGQHNILKSLKEQGFRTFHPIIDESYDDIENPQARMDAICCELERINTLPNNEFNQLISNCSDVIQYNLQLVDKYWTEGFPENYKKLNIFG